MGTRRQKPAPVLRTSPAVTAETGIHLLQQLIDKATELPDTPNIQDSDVEAWRSLARDYLVKTFGSASPNINAVLHASGDGGMYMGISQHEYRQHLYSGLANKIELLNGYIAQLRADIPLLPVQSQPLADASTTQHPQSAKVFIVHGNSHGLEESVARFLEKLDVEPVILHERANAGRTVVEKFPDYADVRFAVVLLTGDDEARVRGSADGLMPRACQNVILELGYFLGKLGRARVCALYEDGVEIPGDYAGVLFVPLDSAGRWRLDLVRELSAAGFQVDANRIFPAD